MTTFNPNEEILEKVFYGDLLDKDNVEKTEYTCVLKYPVKEIIEQDSQKINDLGYDGQYYHLTGYFLKDHLKIEAINKVHYLIQFSKYNFKIVWNKCPFKYKNIKTEDTIKITFKRNNRSTMAISSMEKETW